jgi:hypothetical protein
LRHCETIDERDGDGRAMNKVIYADPAQILRAYSGVWSDSAVALIARRFGFAREEVDAAARAAGIRTGDMLSSRATASRRPQTREQRMAEARSIIAETGVSIASTREERIAATREFIDDVLRD